MSEQAVVEKTRRIQTFPGFDWYKEALEHAELFREWMMSLEWPAYIGVVEISIHGITNVYPEDADAGMPEHFQSEMLKLIPFTKGKIRREFTSDTKTITWDGYIDTDQAPERFKEELKNQSMLICFRGITNTKCKMVPVKKEITIWELDCSEEARAEE